jgi:hypothetical protein
MTDVTQVFKPGWRATDANGDIYSGAVIHFFDAGTSNTRTVYSDRSLSAALGTTVTCDSGGFPTSDGNTKVEVYTGTGAYKVTLKNSSGTTIWTLDGIVGALDTTPFAAATFAKVDEDFDTDTENTVLTTADLGTVKNGNPTGGDFTYTLLDASDATNGRGLTIRHVGTAGKLTLAAAVGQTIDGKASIELRGRYESVTLASDGTNWHTKSDANRSIVGGTITPEGYLTLTSLTPIIASDVTAATAVYYTPFTGNLVPLYDGTRFVNYEFDELTLTLASQHAINTIYDVFAWLESGVVTIGTGPAWATITAGSGARGTGAGTTQLTRTKGLLLNTVAMTTRNSSATYSVAALRATYLGSIFIDGTAGQITCHVSYGQSRKWGVWNAHNRQALCLKGGDSTATWTYASATVQASNATANNKLTTLCGLAEERIDVEFVQRAGTVTNTSTGTSVIGIGLNDTTAVSGKRGLLTNSTGALGGSTRVEADLVAQYSHAPQLGINAMQCLEASLNATTSDFYGSNTHMQITAKWRG